MKRCLLVVVVLFGVSFSLKSQYSYLGGRYEINIPVSDFKDFVGKTSYLGFGFDYNYVFDNDFGLGFSSTWVRFFEELNRDTYVFDRGAVTARVWNYSYNINFMATGSYFVPTEIFLKPYVKLGLGATYTEVIKLVGVFDVFDYVWGFGMKPEFGMLFHFPNTAWGLFASASYNYSTNKSNLFDNVQHWGFAFGLYFCPKWN